jgi:AraC-like DNA-binding protein
MLVKESRLRIKSFDEPELVELHFSLIGGGIMENFLTKRKLTIKANQHNIIYNPDFDCVAEFPKDQQLKFFEVHFQRDKFIDLTSESSILLKMFADDIMNNHAVELSSENLPISLAMHSCIRDIMNCHFTGGLKLLFLQSKCLELLALQAQAFELAAKKPVKACLKSAYDKDRIYYAKEYLIEHANQPPSLSELAKIAGINEFKLKQGFKETFQNTVFGYLSDYKLMKAKELLEEGSLDIKHISDNLGYSSVQHFNTAFSKKFGISPGKAR